MSRSLHHHWWKKIQSTLSNFEILLYLPRLTSADHLWVVIYGSVKCLQISYCLCSWFVFQLFVLVPHCQAWTFFPPCMCDKTHSKVLQAMFCCQWYLNNSTSWGSLTVIQVHMLSLSNCGWSSRCGMPPPPLECVKMQYGWGMES